MGNFIVSVWYNEKRSIKAYNVKAGSFATAAGRALRQFKKDKLTNKRQRTITIYLEKIEKVKGDEENETG